MKTAATSGVPLAGLGISQNSYRRFGFAASYKYEDLTSDSGDSDGSVTVTPQSSYSNKGEESRVDWNKYNSFSLSGHVMLPYKLDVATIFDARDGQRYNITTGTDNNGDGFFNDRPSLASTPGSGVYSTPFGLLTTKYGQWKCAKKPWHDAGEDTSRFERQPCFSVSQRTRRRPER